MSGAQVAKRPSYEVVLRYARRAVRSEFEHPLHRGDYDNAAAVVDVLNHFEGLTNSDEDWEFIRDAVREAEHLEYPDLEL
jgi:hypothetical protein